MKGEKSAFSLGAVVDVETTGLSPDRDEIIELGLVLFRLESNGFYTIIQEYAGLREPSCAIHPRAARVNGITPSQVAGRDLDYRRIAELIRRADFLIAHNAPFDRNFMARIFPEVGQKQWYCSMSDINWRAKGCPNRRLQDLLRYHGIIPRRAHRAGDDVRSTLELLACRQPSGITYLAELLDTKPYCQAADGGLVEA